MTGRGPTGGGRSLKTAAEALAALRFLGAAPAGITAEALGTEIGKSAATARYLLNTLCQEGYAVRDGHGGTYRLQDAPPWGEAWGDAGIDAGIDAGVGAGYGALVEDAPAAPTPPALAPDAPHDDPTSRYELPERLCDAVTELHWRTRQRSYLARWEGDTTVIVDARGHQGLARIPNLSERIPLASAHALAVTKALIASSGAHEQLLREHSDLEPFTGTTITSTPGIELELARVRRHGYAVDREEYAEGFCCIGAPIYSPDGRVAASIAISTPTRGFDLRAEEFTDAVRDVATTATRSWRAAAAGPGAPGPAGQPTGRSTAPTDTGPPDALGWGHLTDPEPVPRDTATGRR
jgi:DNA-binding IclR family transcriptional regulator